MNMYLSTKSAVLGPIGASVCLPPLPWRQPASEADEERIRGSRAISGCSVAPAGNQHAAEPADWAEKGRGEASRASGVETKEEMGNSRGGHISVTEAEEDTSGIEAQHITLLTILGGASEEQEEKEPSATWPSTEIQPPNLRKAAPTSAGLRRR